MENRARLRLDFLFKGLIIAPFQTCRSYQNFTFVHYKNFGGPWCFVNFNPQKSYYCEIEALHFFAMLKPLKGFLEIEMAAEVIQKIAFNVSNLRTRKNAT